MSTDQGVGGKWGKQDDGILREARSVDEGAGYAIRLAVMEMCPAAVESVHTLLWSNFDDQRRGVVRILAPWIL